MDEKQIYHYQIETWYFNHRISNNLIKQMSHLHRSKFWK